MNEISSITSHRLKSVGIISLVESVIHQSPTQAISALHTEAIKFQEGLEMAQAIKNQLEEAINRIIPES